MDDGIVNARLAPKCMGTPSRRALQSTINALSGRGHLTEDVKKKMHSLGSDLVIIPGGMTTVLQPLDVSINKPFKGYVQAEYEKWFCEPNRELTPTGKIKRAAPHIVAGFLLPGKASKHQ